MCFCITGYFVVFALVYPWVCCVVCLSVGLGFICVFVLVELLGLLCLGCFGDLGGYAYWYLL